MLVVVCSRGKAIGDNDDGDDDDGVGELVGSHLGLIDEDAEGSKRVPLVHICALLLPTSS